MTDVTQGQPWVLRYDSDLKQYNCKLFMQSGADHKNPKDAVLIAYDRMIEELQYKRKYAEASL
jgi:hypothetical protein